MTADFAVVVDWIRAADAEPVAAKVVAGASLQERKSLAALGGVVGAVVSRESLEVWPADVLEWVNNGPVPPVGVASAATRAFRDDPDRTLALLYGRLVSGVNRRSLGTFFTPPPEVELMLDMWNDAERIPSTVVDVGAGVGVFTFAAASRWTGARVISVDINPVTLGLLGLRAYLGQLTLQLDSSDRPGARLIRDDFTTWVETIGDTVGPRLILGNPPFTRSQLLPTGERSRLHELADGLCGSRASLSALITAITLRRLGPEDGLSFLLPAQWLEANYANSLRNELAELSSRRIELRLIDSRLFTDALVDAVVLQVGRQRRQVQRFQVATWAPGARDHRKHVVPRAHLIDTPWRTVFEERPRSHSRVLGAIAGGGDRPLTQYCVPRRGTATGANDFFVLTDDEVDRHDLNDAVVKLVRRLVHYPNVVSDSVHDKVPKRDKRWLLHVCPDDRTPGSAIDHYLRIGESQGIHERYLCAARRGGWYDLSHDLVVPDIIVGPMARDTIRFVENRASAAITNNLYGWTWRSDVPSKTRAAVLDWLRGRGGQAALMGVARNRGAGLHKIEPRALGNLSVPDSIPPPPAFES